METVQQGKLTETTEQVMTEADVRRLEAAERTPPGHRPLAPLPPGYYAVEPRRLTTEQFICLHGGPALALVKHGNRRWCKDGASVYHDGFGPAHQEPPPHPRDRLAVQFEWRKWHLRLAEDALRTVEALHRLTTEATSSARFVASSQYRWDREALGKPPLDSGGRLDLPAAVERLRFLVDCRRRKVLALKAELGAHGVEVEERFLEQ
jgi:hypothetical protein